MLRFALKEGLPLSDDLRDNIGELDRVLVTQGLSSDPIAAIPTKLISMDQPTKVAGTAPEEATPALPIGAFILKIHAELSRVVAPATALTLQASEPPPGKHHFLGGMPTLVKAAAVTATICAFGFVATSIIPAAKDAARSATPTSTAVAAPTSSPAPTLKPNS